MDFARIRHEYEKAVHKKKELSEELREIEKTRPDDLYNIWNYYRNKFLNQNHQAIHLE